MTITVIIIFCSLLLISYLFDLTASKTKIPSVILLILLGWGLKQVTIFLGIEIPSLSAVLPVFGTIGLIVIVLEGSLELTLNRSKFWVVIKSFLGAVLPLLASAFVLAFGLQYISGYPLRTCLINVLPFCIISSAIAIPSVRGLKPQNKEFIIYESSLSDIAGVLLFNFLLQNNGLTNLTIGTFTGKLILIVIISFIATITLSLLLSKIEHHIKFMPIILLVILIFAVSEIYHLPALVFILFFGLFIGNLNLIKDIEFVKKFKPEELSKEVQKFKEILVEAAFLVRTLFFLLFGFLLETSEIINPHTISLSLSVVAVIYLFRLIQLLISKMPLLPLLFVAPRGLITILLFLSITPAVSISFVDKSLVIQVIILTAFIMMFGLIINKGPDKKPAQNNTGNPLPEDSPEVQTQEQIK